MEPLQADSRRRDLELGYAKPPVTIIGAGIMWWAFDDEGSMSYLFVRKMVPLEDWATWSRNPATWRKRFPGESVDVPVQDS